MPITAPSQHQALSAPDVGARAITAALGGKWHGRYGMCRCIVHDDHLPSMSVADGHTAIIVKCHAGCDALDILAELRRRGMLDDASTDCHDARPAARPSRHKASDDHDKIAYALRLFDESVSARDSIVETYLASRRLGRLPADVIDLRFHPRCPRNGDRLPAMVALIRDAVTNDRIGVHRTYLRPDGSGKADVEPAKMMLGRAAGGVVKLTPDEDVTMGLGLSEGIEDGIAVVNGDWRPIWACMTAGGMKDFPVLGGIESLTIFSDADAPGKKAAKACAARWRAAGKSVVIVAPRSVKDFAAMAEAGHDDA